MTNKPLLLLALLGFLFAGCAAQRESGFSIPEGITDVNDSLRLTLVEETFSIRTGTAIVVENISEYELIYFSADTDVQLYALQGGEWLPVKNNVIYHPSGDRFLGQSKDNSPIFLMFTVKPLLPDLERRTKLRALVIATVMEGEQATDNKVAAYVDLWVEP